MAGRTTLRGRPHHPKGLATQWVRDEVGGQTEAGRSGADGTGRAGSVTGSGAGTKNGAEAGAGAGIVKGLRMGGQSVSASQT